MRNVIDFKTSKEKEQFEDSQLDDRLRNYITIIALYVWTEFNKHIVITSVYRKDGIHATWRAVDIRILNHKKNDGLSMKERMKVISLISNFHYDVEDNYPVCVYGDDRHLDHFHIQVGYRK